MNGCTVITDGVIDDIVAMWLLYKLAPDAEVTVISTFGNIPEDRAFKNTQEFICLIANNWKLGHGASMPMGGKFEHAWLSNFNGPDGLWGIHPSIRVKNPDTIKKLTHIQVIISLASLTETFKLAKIFRKTLEHTTIMGGVFGEKGNLTSYAECNIAYDLLAAHNFFNERQTGKINMIPLDVTRRVYWTEKMIDAITERTVEING